MRESESSGAESSIFAKLDWRKYPEIDFPPILDVALRNFVERGFDATTVRMIAKDVGCTVPALYYHFDNKQDILLALVERSMDILDVKFEQALTQAGEDVRLQMSYAVQALCLFTTHYKDLAFLNGDLRSLDGENREVYAARRDKTERMFRGIVQRGCDTGVFAVADVAAATRYVLSACQGIPVWYRHGGPSGPEEVAEMYAALSLSMLEAGAKLP